MIVQSISNLFIIKQLILGPGLLIMLGLATYLIGNFVRSKNFLRNRRIFTIFIVCYFLAATFPPCVRLLQLPLEIISNESNCSYTEVTVALGAGILSEGIPTINSQIRAVKASELYLKGKTNLIIFSTGFTNRLSRISESKAMKNVALCMGVPQDKIMLEEKSLNTRQNAAESFRILRAKGINHIFLVTNKIHLPRAASCFQKFGLKVEPVPVDLEVPLCFIPSWESAIELQLVLNEYLGLLYYKARNWI